MLSPPASIRRPQSGAGPPNGEGRPGSRGTVPGTQHGDLRALGTSGETQRKASIHTSPRPRPWEQCGRRAGSQALGLVPRLTHRLLGAALGPHSGLGRGTSHQNRSTGQGSGVPRSGRNMTPPAAGAAGQGSTGRPAERGQDTALGSPGSRLGLLLKGHPVWAGTWGHQPPHLHKHPQAWLLTEGGGEAPREGTCARPCGIWRT